MDGSGTPNVVQERIRCYFSQLTVGCGNPHCLNHNCASSPNFAHGDINNNRAAALAIGFLRDSEPLCFPLPSSSTTQNKDSASQRSSPTVADAAAAAASRATEMADSARALPTQSSVDRPGESHYVGDEHNSDEEMFPSGSHGEVSQLIDPVDLIDRFVKDNTDLDQSENRSLLGKEGSESAATMSVTPPTVSRRVEGLTLQELSSCLDACKASGDWLPFKSLIDDVMMSLTAMAGSFSSAKAASSSSSNDVEMKPATPRQEVENEEQKDHEPSTSRNEVRGVRSGGVGSPRPPVFLNADSDHASPVDIEVAREAFRLMLEKPPKEAGILELVSLRLHLLLVMPLRAILLNPSVNAALSGGGLSSPTDPTYEMLAVAKPSPASEADDMQQRMVNVFAVIYACPLVTDPLYFERLLTHLCHLTTALPLPTQARLCRLWASHASVQRLHFDSTFEKDQSYWLLDLHRILMQQITLRCLAIEPASHHQSLSGADSDEGKPAPNDDRCIREASQVIRLVFFASLLAGDCDSPEQLLREALEDADLGRAAGGATTASSSSRMERRSSKQDALAELLGIKPIDCRHPIISAGEFINETLNDAIVVEKDFVYFRSQPSTWSEKLSFMNFPFMLQTTVKSTQLYYDNRLHMLQERRGALIHSILAASTGSEAAALEMPFFKICVARERVLEDALLALELTRSEAAGDLKKQLFVEFDGEQGIDEGGLSKEFFQLIIQRIFNPDYGMFTFDEGSQCFWFNRTPLGEDLDREYCLIGTILGLAIYNNIILDIHFPSVLYRKLAGKLASSIEDLQDAWPDLARGYQALLDYEGDNFEEDHCLNFSTNYADMFGQIVSHELVPGGNSKPVTIENRQEYVNLSIDFLLNTSVQSQFSAFRKGFLSVVEDTLLFNLFTPPEIELLLRGSQEYDFSELERVTEYEGDYNAETPVVRQFWEVVHNMSEKEQRQLLQFTTGTDRIPIGGMSHLKFVIARQGPDSDRLPSAHTCFNVLLLPEYSSQDKLERCLRTAIANSKGFGML